MNRRVLAALLGLGFVGCTQTQVSPTRGNKPLPPVALEPLPDIHQSINAGLRTEDRNAQLAQHRLEGPAASAASAADASELAAVEADGSTAPNTVADATAAPGAAAGTAAAAQPNARTGASGRSPERSWIAPSPGRALASAGRPKMRADGTLEPNAAAVASAAGGGGAISDALRTPITASTVPPAGTDTSLGAHPDAMPAMDLPGAAETPAQTAENQPAAPAGEPAATEPGAAVAGLPEATGSAPPEVTAAVPLGADPALGATPDAMPPMDLPPREGEPKHANADVAATAPAAAQAAKPEPANATAAAKLEVPAAAPKTTDSTATLEVLDPAVELKPTELKAPEPKPEPAGALAAPAAMPADPALDLPPIAPTGPGAVPLPIGSATSAPNPQAPLPGVTPHDATTEPDPATFVPPVVDPAHGMPPQTGAHASALPAIAPLPPGAKPLNDAPAPGVPAGATTATEPPAPADPMADLPPLPASSPTQAPGAAGLPAAAAPEDPMAGLPPLPDSMPTTPDAQGGLPPLPPPGPASESLPPLPGEAPRARPASAQPGPGASSSNAPAASSAKQAVANASAPVTTIVRLSSADAPRDAGGSPASTAGGSSTASTTIPVQANPGAAAGPRDPAVRKTAADETAIHSELQSVPLEQAGMIAARVGDEIITLQELKNAVREYIKRNAPPGTRVSPRELNMIASMKLTDMIERALILQEIHRRIKNPKQFDKFKEHIESVWQEEELPPMLRKYTVANVYELKEKLKEQGRSLDKIHEEFCNTRMAQEYVEVELRPAITIDLPQMRDYYNAHLNDFDRPAQITWREIVVDTKKYPSRTEARKKAEALLAKLSHGEDFAALAKAESDGPKREQGGLWETSPDSYAVKSVNSAIQTIPLNQVSKILAGPKSYHIVRVEARREAGPARFDEVQLEVHRRLMEEKYQTQRIAFMTKLRERTLVRSIFDNTESAPATAQPPAPQPTSEGLRAN